jgi:hypothetical protein
MLNVFQHPFSRPLRPSPKWTLNKFKVTSGTATAMTSLAGMGAACPGAMTESTGEVRLESGYFDDPPGDERDAGDAAEPVSER